MALLLAPGGILLYSVCTHTQEETEAVREAILGKGLGLELLVSAQGLPLEAAALVGPDGFLRTFPHKHGMDGFSAFKLRRAS